MSHLDQVTLTVLQSPEAVSSRVSAELVALLNDLGRTQSRIDIVLTGGTVAAQVHRSLAGRVDDLDHLDRLHLWWGDDRYLPAGHPERNDQQAERDLLQHLGLRAGNLHPLPADAGAGLSQAVLDAAADLREAPARWDLVMLGAGPDGHVASLFPHHTDMDVVGDVVAVRSSPKPPAERISLAAGRITATRQLWVFATGAAKADAVERALAGETLPLGTVSADAVSRGAAVTWFLDDEAAPHLTV